MNLLNRDLFAKFSSPIFTDTLKMYLACGRLYPATSLTNNEGLVSGTSKDLSYIITLNASR